MYVSRPPLSTVFLHQNTQQEESGVGSAQAENEEGHTGHSAQSSGQTDREETVQVNIHICQELHYWIGRSW